MSKRSKKARRAAQRKKTQKRFKAREAAGLSGLTGGKKGKGLFSSKGSTLSIYRSSQQQKVRDAAAKRNSIFQSKKKPKFSSFSKKLRGIFGRKPSATQQQVNKDNRMYGNTVPSGAIGISKEGKIQAKENKLAAAQRQAAAVRQREQARKARATGVRQVYGEAPGFTQPKKEATRWKNKDYLTSAPYVSAFKRTFMGDGLQGNRFNPADRAAALGAGYTDSITGAVNFGKNNLTLGLGNKLPNIPTLPKFKDANLQSLRNFGSVAIPGLQTFGAAQRLSKVGLGQEISQMTTSNAKYTAGLRPQLTKTGITNVNPLTIAKAFTPQMVATGPTAGASTALLGTTTGLAAAQQAKVNDTQTGGLNIGGGSNISSGSDAVRKARTARKLSSISNRSKRNQNLLAGNYTDYTGSYTNRQLLPDGSHGFPKIGDVINTGGKSGKDFKYDGKNWNAVPLAATPPVPLATASPDASNVQGYINQLSIYGMDPNYMPQFRFSNRGQASGRAYRKAWNRNNFKTTV